MDMKIANIIRGLSIDMIDNAGSGHPGICLDASVMMYTLFSKHLVFNPQNPNWINRDRFILSAGHGSAMLYSTLFLAGYPIQAEELKTFRQMNSRLTGHPELNTDIGVETTTGPLGQGFANAVGMAIGEEYLNKNINDIIDHYTYCLVGDGCLMEGISYEAASLAGSLQLGKLIVLYDSNNISLDGNTNNVFNEDVLKRFEALGWQTIKVESGEDINTIDQAIITAKSMKEKPTIIEIKTIIGLGTSVAGSNSAHGKPLSKEDIAQVKEKMHINSSPFHLSKEPIEHFRTVINNRCMPIYDQWTKRYAEIIEKDQNKKLNLDFLNNNNLNIKLSSVNIENTGLEEEMRITNSRVMNMISKSTRLFVGGSADVSSSCKTYLDGKGDFKLNGSFGPNIHYGVREHAMAAINNGIALMNINVFGSTFLTFSDYLRPSMRLASLMEIPNTFIFTHDSISIGEDGPTHQPIEQLGSIRMIPNMTLFRPADIREILGSWDFIINSKKSVSLVISKEKLSMLSNSNSLETLKGGYIIGPEVNKLDGVIIATGSEVHDALKIKSELYVKGIDVRVVSMPSVDLFLKQPKEYIESCLPDKAKVIVIEASNDPLWNSFVRSPSFLLTLKEFGYSGKKSDIYKKVGYESEILLKKVYELLK